MASYRQLVTERRLYALLLLLTASLFGLKSHQDALHSPKPKVVFCVLIHQGKYDRAFGASTAGMLDNLVVMKHQAERFEPQMKYSFDFLALMSNKSHSLEPYLHRIGWKTKRVDLKYEPHDILNKQIGDEVTRDGAIGIWEMLKMHAWRREVVGYDTQFVALVDTDIHFRQPFDKIFEEPWMAANATLASTQGAWVIEKVNGGFLIVRPDERSEADYDKIWEVLREGDFRSGRGWKGKVGWTYGGRTIQGLLPYYYMYGDGAGRMSQLPRCNVNNMVATDECKAVAAKDVISNHFTGGCLKPWTCGAGTHPLCKEFVDTWWADYEATFKARGMAYPGRCPKGVYASMKLYKDDEVAPPTTTAP